MMIIIGLIISLALSAFNIFNTFDLPQDEDISRSNVVVRGVVDIQQESNTESLEPKRVVKETNTQNQNDDNSSTDWWEYPGDIKTTTRNGDDLLVLVNKEYRLPSTYSPNDLVKVGEDTIRRGSSYYLRQTVVTALKELTTAAKEDNIDLSIVSAYRSYNTQESTYNYWVNYNNGCVSCADRISARAGHSQHQLGTTLDFSSNEINDSLGVKFGDTKASSWLEQNAHKYGFVLSFPKGYEHVTGFSFEPWHYRYIGKSNALEMKSSGMILENYLRSKN
jgi:D-alanyl-D-alanine carboxypeptidase